MGLAVARGEGVVRRSGGGISGMEEVVEGDHVSAHVVGPFQYLGADVCQEGVG